MRDVGSSPDLLSVRVHHYDIELIEGKDLLILDSKTKIHESQLELLPPRVQMLINVKREVESDSVAEMVSQFILLDLLATQPVLGLLTNLRDQWVLFVGRWTESIQSTHQHRDGDDFVT